MSHIAIRQCPGRNSLKNWDGITSAHYWTRKEKLGYAHRLFNALGRTPSLGVESGGVSGVEFEEGGTEISKQMPPCDPRCGGTTRH